MTITKDHYKEWFGDLNNRVGATFTLKQKFNDFRLDKIRSSTNFKHFMNRLNQKLYGNSAQRFKNGVGVIPVHEHDSQHRHHIHATFGRPDRIEYEQFQSLIFECWQKTVFGYNQLHIVDKVNDGWIDYTLKRWTKSDLSDSIDILNVCLTAYSTASGHAFRGIRPRVRMIV